MDLQSDGHYWRKCDQTCVCVYHGLAAIEHLFLFHLMYVFVVFVHMLNWKTLRSKQQLGFHFILLSFTKSRCGLYNESSGTGVDIWTPEE